MSMTFATNIEADGNNTRSIGTSANKFILNGTGNCAAFYGTCATAAATAQKEVICAEFTDANLVTGTTIRIKFTYANGKASPTLKINSGTAKTIYRYGTTAPSTTAATSWNAGAVVSFTYDGTYWQMNDWLNNDTTSTVNQSAVITTAGEYCLLHANNTGTAARNGYAVYKSSATINPSTGAITATNFIGNVRGHGEAELITYKVVLSSISSLPKTYTCTGMTADHEVVYSYASVPEAQASDWTITTAADSITVSGTFTGSTSTDLTLFLTKPNVLTATSGS